ncbi:MULTISPECIES: hypothetical protein [unclassified Bradyrhizobium]|nr:MULTISPECIES: hypothetical protein [unclassified Bradyrhizobium]
MSIAATHQPATDLGHLLNKHLGGLREIKEFGKAPVAM